MVTRLALPSPGVWYVTQERTGSKYMYYNVDAKETEDISTL